MAAPEAEPSRDNPAEQAFNFSAMNDGQVVMLGRFIITGIDREFEEDRSVLDSEDVARLYVGAMAVLLAQDPDRAKAILKRQALSPDNCDEEMAVRCTRRVVQSDYELARDIIVHAIGSDGDAVSDTAVDVATDIRDGLEPSQRIEFNQALRAALHAAPDRITPLGLVT